MTSDSDSEIVNVKMEVIEHPPDVEEAGNDSKPALIPEMSFGKYKRQYDNYHQWKIDNSIEKTTEEALLAYFEEMAKGSKSSTLWARYSMLKRMIDLNENVQIDKFTKLLHLLKCKKKGYIAEKSRIFTADEIQRFLRTAPDVKYLAIKVFAIFGVAGDCRGVEFTKIQKQDVEIHGKIIIIRIHHTKTGSPRSFIVEESLAKVVKKYMDLRPAAANTRFFVHYRDGKCTTQFIGKHMFERMPKDIAKYLELEESEKYTGYSFRKTSLVDSSNDAAKITSQKVSKPSNAIEEVYLDESLMIKTEPDSEMTDVPSTSSTSPKTSATISKEPSSLTMDNSRSSPKPELPILTSQWKDLLEIQVNRHLKPREREIKSQNATVINITGCNFYFGK